MAIFLDMKTSIQILEAELKHAHRLAIRARRHLALKKEYDDIVRKLSVLNRAIPDMAAARIPLKKRLAELKTKLGS
jgi:hypothetical protein